MTRRSGGDEVRGLSALFLPGVHVFPVAPSPLPTVTPHAPPTSRPAGSLQVATEYAAVLMRLGLHARAVAAYQRVIMTASATKGGRVGGGGGGGGGGGMAGSEDDGGGPEGGEAFEWGAEVRELGHRYKSTVKHGPF